MYIDGQSFHFQFPFIGLLLLAFFKIPAFVIQDCRYNTRGIVYGYIYSLLAFCYMGENSFYREFKNFFLEKNFKRKFFVEKIFKGGTNF